MDISVVVEQIDGNGFRATSFAPKQLVAEGRTRDEALHQLTELVRGTLSDAELVQLQVPLPGEPHPWKDLAGTWRDHPDADEIEKNIRQYRKDVDTDLDRL